MKFSNKLFLTFILFLFNSNLSYASSINDIKILDENNINFAISNDVVLGEGELDAEIKVMKDINISFISKDFEDKNKLILNLSSDIKQNSSYSLITILGPEGNMDFITGLSLENSEILNSQKIDIDKQGIKRLVVVNPTTLELYFNNIIQEDELEFKLFNELSVSSIGVTKTNNVNMNLLDKMDKSSNYILMVLSMSDDNGHYISLDEDLYELRTDKNLKSFIGDEKIVETEELDVEEDSIEDFALNSAETPDTGPETTVLIILTFIFNTIFIFRKKVLKK